MPTLAEIAGYGDDPRTVGGGLLGLLTSFVDNRKRALMSLKDIGLLGTQMNEDARAYNRERSASAGGLLSVIPEVRDAAAQGSLNQAMNMGGLLGTIGGVPKYGISHRPMQVEGGASRLHDLVPAFGEDVYGKNALQFFGSGDMRETAILRLMQKVRNNPDAEVTIYRGVPKDAKGEINHGDWVTLDPRVARDYGEQVVTKKVKAKDITSWADSLLEFGYYPEP